MLEYVYSKQLSKTARNGPAWAHVDVTFPEKEVIATITLSAYRQQAPESFQSHQPNSATAYIVTPQTPMGYSGTVSWPTRWDARVHLTTDRLTFWLAVVNGGNFDDRPPVYAKAVGSVYEVVGQPINPSWAAGIVEGPSFVVFDEQGDVVATHRSVRFDGGVSLDEEEVREQVLAQAHDLTGREAGSLQVAAFDPQEVPDGTELRVDPSTGRVEALASTPDLDPFGRLR